MPIIEARLRIALKDPPTTLAITGDIEALLGYAAADFLSGALSLRERIHADDQDIADHLFSTTAKPTSGHCNLRLRHADGRIRCIAGQYRKRHDSRGHGILNLILRDAKSLSRGRDIAALPAGFKAMLEGTDDYIYFKNRHHVFTAVSQTITELTPVRQWADLLGLTDYEVFPETYADSYYALEKKILAGAPMVRETQEIIDKHGNKGWLDNRKYPIHDKRGVVIGLYGIARIITREKQAEDALRESEASLRNAQRLASLGSYTIDLRTGALKGSAELYRITGIDPEQPLTMEAWVAMVHPEDRPAALAYLSRNTVEQDKDSHIEYRIVRPSDGATRWVRSIGQNECDDAGRPIQRRGSIQDVTEQHEQAMAEQRAILGNQMIGVAAVRDDRIAWANEAFEAMLGYDRSELSGMPTRQLYANDLDYAQGQAMCRSLAGNDINHSEREFVRKDGRRIWIAKAAALLPRTGQGPEYLWTFVDISERKEAEQRLRLAASVFASANEGIIITTPDGAIIDTNEAFTRITGYQRDEVLGKNPRILGSGRHDREFFANVWRDLERKSHWYGEIWNRRKNGDTYPENLSIAAVRDAQGTTQHYVGVFSDITTLKDRERQLEHFAHYDALTHLPNRVLLADRLQYAMTQAQRRGNHLAIVYLDLDGFKAVNDSYGHETGDRLLIGVTDHLREALREGDTLARIGGDEFVVVLSDLENREAAIPPLERLLAAAAQPVILGNLEIKISASLGFTIFPQSEAIDADQLLRQADQAMYQAKLSGRNRYHLFDAEHDRSMRGRHDSLEHIRQGLARNEFVLHFQPKVNMYSGAVLGAEALIRWRHPERGLLSPGEFLPLIENHPLNIDIGQWVIETALAQMAAWQAQGLRLPVSVNVSGNHLLQADFVDRLRDALAQHSLMANMLSLEVLETSALEDISHATRTIEACRTLGVSCALDDFGTGYSSLTYLKRLPATLLKIDQSFIRDMLNDPDDLAILDGVIGLASAFHREVIAEGVETIQQGELLLQLGCELAQGYGIARPMSGDQIPGWTSGWRPAESWQRQTPIERRNLPLLFAGVEHLAWLAVMERYLDGHSTMPPNDVQHCAFGRWLAQDAKKHGLAPAILQEIDILHQEIHRLADDVLTLHHRQDAPAAQARMQELRTLGNGLFARLRQLASAL